jgi:hypothetical protein
VISPKHFEEIGWYIYWDILFVFPAYAYVGKVALEEIDCSTLASYHIPPFIYRADAEEPFEKAR